MKFSSAGIAAALLIGFSVHATEPQFSGKRVSIRIENVGIKKALENVLQMDSIKFDFSKKVNDGKRISINVKDAKVSDVFSFLIKEGSFRYTIGKDGTLHIGI